MILGITWWGFLLHSKNQSLYDLQLSLSEDLESIAKIQAEKSRQNLMIIGEGIFLGFSLLIGIYIINRSAQKEIKTTRQQNDFLLSVSHELKSPIAAIKLALQTLNKRKLEPEDHAEIISSGIQDVNRLNKMVQNVLVGAKMDNTDLELYKASFDFNELLFQLINAFRKDFPDWQFNLDVPEDDLHIDADKINLQLVLSNVLDNAVKYSNDQNIDIKLYKDPQNVNCSISNSGPAIEKDERNSIFEKFYRGKNKLTRSKEGTGLGLYIANQIVLAHGGTLKLNSSGGINEFIISIPGQ